jgi:hypothetical protein
MLQNKCTRAAKEQYCKARRKGKKIHKKKKKIMKNNINSYKKVMLLLDQSAM